MEEAVNKDADTEHQEDDPARFTKYAAAGAKRCPVPASFDKNLNHAGKVTV